MVNNLLLSTVTVYVWLHAVCYDLNWISVFIYKVMQHLALGRLPVSHCLSGSLINGGHNGDSGVRI